MARFMEDYHTGAHHGAESATLSRPVDLVHLARHTFGNRELEIEILQLFVRQSQIMMQRLDDAADATAWRTAAHTIKGSALGIGAWRVARLAAELERLANDQHSANAVATLVALGTAVAEANGFIRNLIEG